MTEQGGGRSRQGYLAVVVCILGLSFSPLFYKMTFAAGMHALWVNVLRLLITVIIMVVIAFANPKNRRAILSISKRSFWLSALAGTLLAFHLNGWALALAYTETFAASTIMGTYVLLTVLFASLILKEKTSKGALTGLIIATVGVVVCNLGGGIGRFGGNMFALFAAITEALYVLCGREARKEMGVITYTTILYSFTLLWMVVMALFVPGPVIIPAEGILWVGLLAVVTTLLGHSMASVALKHFKAVTVSAVMMSGIITGPLITLIFLGEQTTPYTLIGGTVIILGLSWYMVMERREARQIARCIAESAADR